MMPFYGSFDHLRKAVESVLDQKDERWTLTVVDDVYPDLAPGEWVRSIGDRRIRYLRNEKNLRPSRNYNKCIELASSEFVVLMGCDDVMLPNYVGRVLELIEQNPGTSLIQPGVSVIDGNGKQSHPLADRVKALYRPRGHGMRVLGGERLATSLLRGNWTYFPSLAWRTETVRRSSFRTDLDVVQDLAMLLEIIKAGGTMVLDDQVVFNYRRHSTSVSAVTGPDGSKFRQERTLFDESASAFTALGWPKAARAARNHITSRMNALSEIPAAIRARNVAGRRTLTQHVFGRPYSDPEA